MTNAARPYGSVTLMFTDIEGSTKLLERLRERYAVLLEQQRDILRAAFARHAGHEVDTQGDSFFVAFASAAEALACAVEIQRDLAAHEWPDGVALRVRIGVHTGQPAIAATGYVGIDVHRGARIGAAASGGQVLASDATSAAAAGAMPADIELSALGIFRFKGLAEPLAVFEVHAPGLDADFPPIQTSPPEDEPPAPGEPPYKGLLRFDEEDAARFFGREEPIAQIVAAVNAEPFVAVVGASGSGKSSLIRAGVIPTLKAQAGTTTAVMTPTADPVTELDTALEDHPDVLIVDQFEELFTLVRDDAMRQRFVQRLMSAVEAGLHVLVTLRADFYASLGEYPALREAIVDHQLYIGPMDAAGLRRAIEEPARQGGWDIAPGLVDLLLRDVGSEPGALPLLSHALLETWSRRRGSRMTLKGYFESGEVRGAIAKTADRLYVELSPSEQRVTREILLRLTELGEGTQDTRRRVRLDELVPDADADGETASVLSRLVDARLVTVDEGSAEVAHEALIREWPLLRTWLHEDREGLHTQRQITDSATEWETLNREPSLLFRGARLATAHEWADAHPRALMPRERTFIDASIEAEEADRLEREAQQARALEAERRRAEQQTEANRRLRRRAFVLAGLVVVAGVLGAAAFLFAGQASEQATVARNEADHAERERKSALSRQLAAQATSTRGGDLDLSLLLGVESVRIADTGEARASLLGGLISEPHLDSVLAKTGRLASASVGADGASLALVADTGRVELWDLVSGTRTAEWSAASEVFASVALSADGKTLVSETGDTEGRIDVYDANSGSLRTSFEVCPLGDIQLSPDATRLGQGCGDGGGYHLYDLATGQAVAMLCVGTVGRFNPDGTRLAIGCEDGTRIYDPRSGSLVKSLPELKSLADLAFSDDGTVLLAVIQDEEHGTVSAWTVADGQPLAELQGGGLARFLPGEKDRFVRVTDTAIELWTVGAERASASFDCTPAVAGSGLTGANPGVGTLGYARDGSRVAVTCATGIEVLALPDLMPIATLHPPGVDLTSSGSSMAALSFNADGKLASLSFNDFLGEGTLAAWSLDRADRLARQLVGFSDPDQAVIAVSPDLSTAAIASGAFTRIALWDVEAGRALGDPVEVPPTEAGPFAGFSANGQLVAVGASGGPDIAILDVSGLAEVARFEAPGGVQNFAFSADGGRIAVGGPDTITIWDIATKTKALTLDHRGDLPTAFSPDGKILAVDDGSTATLWDLTTNQPIGELAGKHDRIMSNLIFSPDGKVLATTSLDQTVALWDVSTRQRLGTPLRHDTGVVTAAFSPDGKMLATSGFGSGTTLLWDLSLRQAVGTLPDSFVLGFRPDGRQLAVTRAGGIFVWDIDPSEWLATACSVAGRNLSEDEWARYLGEEPYHETCVAASSPPATPSATPDSP